MIGGAFFLASIIAIFIVLNWFTKNETIPENQPTKGILAMKLPDTDVEPPKQRRWIREDAARGRR